MCLGGGGGPKLKMDLYSKYPGGYVTPSVFVKNELKKIPAVGNFFEVQDYPKWNRMIAGLNVEDIERLTKAALEKKLESTSPEKKISKAIAIVKHFHVMKPHTPVGAEEEFDWNGIYGVVESVLWNLLINLEPTCPAGHLMHILFGCTESPYRIGPLGKWYALAELYEAWSAVHPKAKTKRLRKTR